MCAAAALGACPPDGNEPNRAVAVTTANPVVAKLGASLSTFIATLPLSAQAWTSTRERVIARGRSFDRRFCGAIAAASRRVNVANAGVHWRVVLKSVASADQPSAALIADEPASQVTLFAGHA